jgi:hypothetical protein
MLRDQPRRHRGPSALPQSRNSLVIQRKSVHTGQSPTHTAGAGFISCDIANSHHGAVGKWMDGPVLGNATLVTSLGSEGSMRVGLHLVSGCMLNVASPEAVALSKVPRTVLASTSNEQQLDNSIPS